MANELVHPSVGTQLTQAEYESVTGHQFNSQATGDILYASSATQLSRLGIGTGVLYASGGVPTWSAAPVLTSPTIQGTVLAGTGLTLPAFTLGGAITGGNQNINNIGHMGFANNASSTTAVLTLSKAFTSEDNNNKYGYSFEIRTRRASDVFTGQTIAGYLATTIQAANSQNWTHALGLVGGYAYLTNEGTASGAHSITGAVGFLSEIAPGNNDTTFTNWYGFYAKAPTGTASKVTNAYGLYIENISGAATLSRSIFVAGGTSEFDGVIQADGGINMASAAVLAGLGTGANGFKLKNLKNAAASALSGTQLDVEIDIGGTPYYFTVYPTKA